MHSGFQIPEIQHQQQHQQQQAPVENSAPVLLSMNQTHILDQIHTLPTTTQQLLLDQHHFLPPQSHYIGGAAAASSPYFPLNFKLGLNTRNDYKDVSSINGGDALLRGSEQYQVPETRQHLTMLQCWQNQEESANKQPTPFWEPLPAEVSNENSEIVDRQENLEMKTCLDSKTRVHFGELEDIYKRFSNQTGPSETLPVLPLGFDHGSEVEEEASKKKRKLKNKRSFNQLINPMAEFFGNLVKEVMDHQENLQKKFMEVIERLDDERRVREEAWRKQELARIEREASARANEKALKKAREAVIVSYLEKITGENINLTSYDECGKNEEDGVEMESEV